MGKSYTVSYGPTMWECSISVEQNDETLANIKSMVEFWSDWEDRLDTNDGEYVKTFLQQLAREINYIQAEHNYNLHGVIAEFKNREGWWPMDGSAGIQILQIDDFAFDHWEYEVLEDPAS